MNSTSTVFSFRQKDPESSESIACIAGTRKATAQTERSEQWLLGDVRSGMKSLREVEKYNIRPNVIRSLKVGECVLIEKYPESWACTIRVRAPMTLQNETGFVLDKKLEAVGAPVSSTLTKAFVCQPDELHQASPTEYREWL